MRERKKRRNKLILSILLCRCKILSSYVCVMHSGGSARCRDGVWSAQCQDLTMRWWKMPLFGIDKTKLLVCILCDETNPILWNKGGEPPFFQGIVSVSLLTVAGEELTFHKRQLCDSKWDESGRDLVRVSTIRVLLCPPCYVPSIPPFPLANLFWFVHRFFTNCILCFPSIIFFMFILSHKSVKKHIKK